MTTDAHKLTALQIDALNRILDSLDALFDGKVGAVQILSALQAVSADLAGTVVAAELASASGALLTIVRSTASLDKQQSAALDATGDLRIRVASLV